MKNLAIRPLSAAIALLCLSNAWAQDAVPADANTVVVSGIRKSYADAVNMKRDTLEITDSISSDGLGRFPDLNVGEAIQRIPGVQLNREAGSRNATINLRGLPGTFALTTINGMSFAQPVLNGSTPLGAFNSDIFSAVTVLKSPTAAEQPGGLSGNIDLRITSALARKDGGAIAIGDEYDELGHLTTPNANVSWNKHFGKDLAVFGVYAYKKEDFRRDSTQVQDYDQLTAANLGITQAQFDARYPKSEYAKGILFPGQIRQTVTANTGATHSGAAGVGWRMNGETRLNLTGYFSDRKLDSSNQYLNYIDPTANSPITNLGPIFTIDTPTGKQAMINSYDYANASITDSLRSAPQRQRTHGLSADVDWENDEWHFNGAAHSSRAENRQDQLSIDIVQSARTLPGSNGTYGHYYSGGEDLKNSVLTLFTPTVSHINPGPYDQRPGTSVTQARNNGNDRFGVTGTNGRALTSVDALQVFAERSFEEGFFKSVKAGLRAEQNDFVSTGTRNTAQGINFAAIQPSLAISNPYVASFAGGYIPGYTKNWVAVDIPAVLNAVKPVTVLPGQTLTPYGLVNNDADPGFSSYNFSVKNRIASGYVSSIWGSSLFGVPLKGNLGARYETTRETVDSLDTSNVTVTIPGGTKVVTTRTPRQFEQSYRNFLPSLVAKADLSEKIALRGAAYRTFVRPQPRDITPSTVVTEPALGTATPTYNVVLGSADLKPYTANSFDLALEWYNRPNGLVALTVFQKDVKGLVGPVRDVNRLCPADATALGLGHLSIVGNNCLSDILVNVGTAEAPSMQPARVVITGQTNQQKIKVNGVEFNVQQNLDWLPAPWNNLGGAFNYAYTTIKGRNDDGSAATLPGVSRNNYNLIAYYETRQWGVRAVYNYRDDYDLAAGGTFNGAARSVKARGQLDMSASYTFANNFKVSFDAFNMSNSMREEYEGSYLKPRRLDVDGRTYQLKLSTTF
ncbi:TonB-dependent receptor [Duganella sp. sic0402]|uniref:TonB-dependent receptor n=1 Tax=Duganella sp. sic0402 TaxID=2854786 RepID=UPI001C438D66|nr:TonB-dependent receptor [Duganella sp. sic0402]MBV7539270.1 TonB-dependent receptor [Duganella sp. sic0402]